MQWEARGGFKRGERKCCDLSSKKILWLLCGGGTAMNGERRELGVKLRDCRSHPSERWRRLALGL